MKWSRYRPGVAQRAGRGIALLFHDRGTRRGWVVSSTTRSHFTPGKDPLPILQEAGWVPGLVWASGKSRPHRYSMPDRSTRSQSLYRLSCRAHNIPTCIYGYCKDLSVAHTILTKKKPFKFPWKTDLKFNLPRNSYQWPWSGLKQIMTLKWNWNGFFQRKTRETLLTCFKTA